MEPWIVNLMVGLSLVAIVYGALVCLTQRDWKRLVAYSSVSHMGFCTLGIFTLNEAGIAGSVIQQVNHGISTGLLFLLVGFIYERRHSREISDYGGVAQVMPMFATVFAIAVFSSAGLPLLNGFIGDFSVLAGAFAVNRVWALTGVVGLILGAAYLLWLYQRTMMGPLKYQANRSLRDLDWRERLIVLPLVLLAFLIGLYPKPVFGVVAGPVREIVRHLTAASANTAETCGAGCQPAGRLSIGPLPGSALVGRTPRSAAGPLAGFRLILRERPGPAIPLSISSNAPRRP
jgi:NADH-quinone oxidoreductase subunit M